MKLELTRFINEKETQRATFVKLNDAYDCMKVWLSANPGEFGTKNRYDKHFVVKNLCVEGHVIFPDERQTEGKDYFLLKQLEAPPAKKAKRPQDCGEVDELECDLHPIRWECPPPNFVGPFACIIAMSKSAFKKYLDDRVKATREYAAFAKEVSDRKGACDLTRFVQITADINRLEGAYLTSVRHFLMYMCQSSLPPVESLYDMNQLCLHTPANKWSTQLRILEIAMEETFNLPDFNSRDMGTLGDLLKKLLVVQENIDGSLYANDDIVKDFEKIDPTFFLQPSFDPYLSNFLEFAGEELMWKAVPTDQDFTMDKYSILEALRGESTTLEFLLRLEELGYSSAQIQFVAFGGEESPADQGSYDELIAFFTDKLEYDEVRRVKDLKRIKWPEASALLPEVAALLPGERPLFAAV